MFRRKRNVDNKTGGTPYSQSGCQGRRRQLYNEYLKSFAGGLLDKLMIELIEVADRPNWYRVCICLFI